MRWFTCTNKSTHISCDYTFCAHVKVSCVDKAVFISSNRRKTQQKKIIEHLGTRDCTEKESDYHIFPMIFRCVCVDCWVNRKTTPIHQQKSEKRTVFNEKWEFLIIKSGKNLLVYQKRAKIAFVLKKQNLKWRNKSFQYFHIIVSENIYLERKKRRNSV